jgi:hypothetical protein
MVTPAVAGGHPQALGGGIRCRILPVEKSFRGKYIKFDIFVFKLPAFNRVVNKNFRLPRRHRGFGSDGPSSALSYGTTR